MRSPSLTDYAIDLARDRFCARVPLDRGKMDIIVHYLNALNEPYRTGQKDFPLGRTAQQLRPSRA